MLKEALGGPREVSLTLKEALRRPREACLTLKEALPTREARDWPRNGRF